MKIIFLPSHRKTSKIKQTLSEYLDKLPYLTDSDPTKLPSFTIKSGTEKILPNISQQLNYHTYDQIFSNSNSRNTSRGMPACITQLRNADCELRFHIPRENRVIMQCTRPFRSH